MKKQDKSKSNTILAAFISGVTLVALIEIANEYFDIPSLIFNDPPTPARWPEVVFEILLIFIVGLSIGLLLTRLLSATKANRRGTTGLRGAISLVAGACQRRHTGNSGWDNQIR